MDQLPARVVIVELATRRYGIAVHQVQRVVRMVRLTPLPGAPVQVPGVIDLAGEIVPVVDLRVRFGHVPHAVRASDHLVIARAATRTVALWVDRVADLVEVAAPEPLPANTPDQPHIRGLARTADGLLVITDVDGFLSAEDDTALTSALVAASD